MSAANYTPETIVATEISYQILTFAKIMSVYIIEQTVYFLVTPLQSKILDKHFYPFKVDAKSDKD